jgi:methyl-accepting chemotaxis protein
MHTLISPVVNLMGRLRLIPKFFIVAVLFAAPAIVVSTLLLNELNKSISLTEKERLGVAHVVLTQDLLRLTQQHRALRHLALAGNIPAAQGALKKQEEITAKLTELDNLQKSNSEMDLAPGINLAMKAWTDIIRSIPTTKAKESYVAHIALIDQLYKLSSNITDQSHLSLDPEVDTYYLINVFSKALPELANVIADIAARGAPYIDTGLLEPNEDVLINANIMWAKRDIDRLPAKLETMFRENASLKEKIESPQVAIASNLKFLDRAKSEVSNAVDQTNGTEFLAAGTQSVDALYAYARAAGKLLDTTLAERTERNIFNRNLMLAAILLTLLIALYLLAGFYLSFSREIRKLSTAVESVTAGNLSNQIQSKGNDEVAQLLNAFDGMRQVLARLVTEIRLSTDSISTASSEIAHGNADLSTRTEHQASALEETSASMEELTTAVKQNTKSAQQANQNAVSAAEIAKEGGVAVTQMIAMMDAIQRSSQKIGDIIGVIDGIAFQTNILALNAAVEAARAGEQGRGFAVVATEVRNLAQRSASAAREIKSLITTSVEQVGAGSRQVQTAGQTMQQIVLSIDAVTDNMRDITAASAGQQAGIEQVNQTLSQLDEITQQNAALVEQAAAAAESMHDQTILLTKAVAVFTLEDETAAESLKGDSMPHQNQAGGSRIDMRRLSESKVSTKAAAKFKGSTPKARIRLIQNR